MSNLITISGVRGYIDENGVAQLNLEDCARGLGFTEIAKSGNECVKWSRVHNYLEDLKFIDTSVDAMNSQYVGKETFIPENIFYRLAMKAKNETAEKFQSIVCDEILPQIRKTGTYNPQQLTKMQILELAMESEKKVIELQATIEKDKPKVLFADSVSASNTTILVGELAKILKQNGIDIGQNRLFERLRNDGFLISRKGTDYNMPTQKSMDMGLFTIKETSITHSDGHISLSKTTKCTGKGQVYFIYKFLNSEKSA